MISGPYPNSVLINLFGGGGCGWYLLLPALICPDIDVAMRNYRVLFRLWPRVGHRR